ncbi:MAG: mycothione reductase [Acidimicrobiaceae bacterium]|nr:mycothione reductase [Acidimicrobiaceae bacterium]
MSENGDTFDLIIIGSGSGNHIPEFLNDWRIAMVERDVFGGTCLNRGCIPSKMLVLPADRAVEADEARSLGVDITVNGADWLAIRDRVFGRIDPISESGRGYRAERCENVTLIEGTGQFVRSEIDGMHAVDVDGRRITAPNVLVAVGSRPSLPPIAGLQECGFHTSDSIMRLDTFPSRLGIIGGGYIAAEMGHVFSGLGSEVTLFNRSATMLSRHDSDIATTFTEEFRRRVSLQLGHLPSKVERTSQGIEMHCDGNIIIVDELLLATGREPNSDLLNCDLVGLETSSRGIVTVDSQMRTSVPGIWAIGDVANEHQLKHVANAEVDVAFWNMAHADDQQVVTQRHVPAAVFSYPQVASVGLTEQAASAENRDVVIGRRDYAGTAYGWALGDGPGFAKVIVDRASDEILGAHIIGPQAATLIQPLVQAMQFSQTATQVARDVYYIHPALTEVIENALLDAIGQR